MGVRHELGPPGVNQRATPVVAEGPRRLAALDLASGLPRD
jgi:hypothetical protein